MREHEVPTHVQAEDKVLLGFTFPQVVAVMAVFALSYGAYRYAPVGPSEARMALAVLFGLVGVAMTVGKIGGRRFGKRRGKNGGNQQSRDHRAETLETRRRKPRMGWFPVVALAVLMAAVVAVLQSALADGHEDGGWSSDEIEFQPPQPVEGRRLFAERLSVTGDRAAVTLRAATALDLRVRAFGGPQGRSLRFWGSASLDEGERIDYSLPLHGPAPSLTFSWEDELEQAGAVTVEGGQIPYPLPEVEGELCDLRMTSLGWTPGAVSGVIESECEVRVEEPVELQTVAGHVRSQRQASVPFVPNGETRFRLGVPTGEAIHVVTVDVSLEASLRIPMPPLTQLTHQPARVQHVTKTVHLLRPGDSDYDSETVTVSCGEGATSSATATAYAYVPSVTIAKEVTVDVQHPEHVRAEVVERSPIAKTRNESLSLASSVGSDDPFEALVLPEPEPVDPPAEQTPADGDLSDWFRILAGAGWEWPW